MFLLRRSRPFPSSPNKAAKKKVAIGLEKSPDGAITSHYAWFYDRRARRKRAKEKISSFSISVSKLAAKLEAPRNFQFSKGTA